MARRRELLTSGYRAKIAASRWTLEREVGKFVGLHRGLDSVMKFQPDLILMTNGT